MTDAYQNIDAVVSMGARDKLQLRVLRALQANPVLSQRQLAAESGVSLGGVNYALKALFQRGLVIADNFRKAGKKVAHLYVPPLQGVAEKASLATAFLSRKLEEYEILRHEIEALRGEVQADDSRTEVES